ncbi:hypothetical protein BJX61DRAFT_415268 [Aspergillus egyptiacus]|nr:hypothetical protein BJX61DRAFT_415268 [Aspergillus egyptiacus]
MTALSPSPNRMLTPAITGSVENEDLWLGFRNMVSGTYLGHNRPKRTGNFGLRRSRINTGSDFVFDSVRMGKLTFCHAPSCSFIINGIPPELTAPGHLLAKHAEVETMSLAVAGYNSSDLSIPNRRAYLTQSQTQGLPNENTPHLRSISRSHLRSTTIGNDSISQRIYVMMFRCRIDSLSQILRVLCRSPGRKRADLSPRSNV